MNEVLVTVTVLVGLTTNIQGLGDIAEDFDAAYLDILFKPANASVVSIKRRFLPH